ncbi:MAG: CopG family transcriptional regulator [Thermoprotei archaeon]|nr:MAG: CopG family transcriptional regulator [Thermoprotei archaeon]
MGEKVAVEISKEIYDKVKKFIEDSGEFKSVEEFVEFVLREVLEEEGAEEAVYSKEEEEEIKKRLRALGYL